MKALTGNNTFMDEITIKAKASPNAKVTMTLVVKVSGKEIYRSTTKNLKAVSTSFVWRSSNYYPKFKSYCNETIRDK